MNYTDRRVQRSVRSLKSAFIELLSEKHFHAITIMEIAEKANYNRGTFYAHFGSKDALLNRVVEDLLDDINREIKAAYRQKTEVYFDVFDPDEITLFKYIKAHQSVFKLLISRQVNIDFRLRLSQSIELLFIEEVDYFLEETDDLDLKWFYIFRANGIAGMIVNWIEEDFKTSCEHMAEQVIKLMTVSTTGFTVKTHKGSRLNEI